MSKRLRRILAGLLALSTAVALAGCAASPDAKPVVLRIATDDTASTPAGAQIVHFAADVERLSKGAVTVVPDWHAAGDVRNWDQANAKLVMSGTVALGLIPSRAWDTLGVTTLRPLSTPFLITSDTQLKAAVTGKPATTMLAGLAKASVTGMALLPESLRHPFGEQKPLLKASDYAGGVIRTPTSATTTALFTALGATTTDADLTTTDRGADSSYALAPGGTVATSNVVLFPKVNVLVANSKALARLTAAQRSALRQAAGATRQWAVSTLTPDATAAAAFCKQGGTIAQATAADVAGLRAAAAQVRTSLEQDPTTARIIASLSAEVGPAPAMPDERCAAASTGSGAVLSTLHGTWSVTTTDATLRAAGVTDGEVIDNNAGTLVMTFDGAKYSWKSVPQKGYSPSQLSAAGDVTVSGDAATIFWTHEAGDHTTVVPHRTAKGDLSFTGLQDAEPDPQYRALDRALFDQVWTPAK